jgi:hypothetical protein
MLLNYAYLRSFPKVFRALTGLDVPEFADLIHDILPRWEKAERQRLSRRDRKRDLGGGPHFELTVIDQLLLTVIWLRCYPIQEVLGFLFGISDTTAGRYINRMLPRLEQSGRDTMRRPDPGRRHRPGLNDLFNAIPELKAVVIDTFEQRVQRHPNRAEADTYYSGKKKAHTLKSQVAVNLFTGEFVDISQSVRGPTADLTLLKASELLARLPDDVRRLFDLAYVGVEQLCPNAVCLLPRRKPRNQPRPPEDAIYNTMIASCRIKVEHSIGRLRWYESLKQVDRHHRENHTARVVSVAGLVNLQIRSRWLKSLN